jgi:hypothetical protein
VEYARYSPRGSVCLRNTHPGPVKQPPWRPRRRRRGRVPGCKAAASQGAQSHAALQWRHCRVRVPFLGQQGSAHLAPGRCRQAVRHLCSSRRRPRASLGTEPIAAASCGRCSYSRSSSRPAWMQRGSRRSACLRQQPRYMCRQCLFPPSLQPLLPGTSSCTSRPPQGRPYSRQLQRIQGSSLMVRAWATRHNILQLLWCSTHSTQRTCLLAPKRQLQLVPPRQL